MKKLFFLLALLLSNLFGEENYFIEAGKYYDVNPTLLFAVAKAESGLDPNAINCANTNQSCDYGLMQINSIHLPFLKKYGITKEDLFNPRINIFMGAYVLKNCINKHGENYKALNCYNGRIKNNDYYTKVLNHYEKTLIAQAQQVAPVQLQSFVEVDNIVQIEESVQID